MSDGAGAFVPAGGLLVLAVGCLWGLLSSSSGPSSREQRSFFTRFLWENARGLYVVLEKGFFLLGLIACLAGAAFIVRRAALAE